MNRKPPHTHAGVTAEPTTTGASTAPLMYARLATLPRGLRAAAPAVRRLAAANGGCPAQFTAWAGFPRAPAVPRPHARAWRQVAALGTRASGARMSAEDQEYWEQQMARIKE
eukprot:130446-Chlamydomonas_euryale.AAC.2